MKDLFEYLDDRGKKNMKITIGQWLGCEFKNIVKEKELSSEIINNLDRMRLAEKYLNNKMGKYTFDIFKQWFKGNRDYDMYEVENDIAQFIDLNIPKVYYVYLRECAGKEYIKGEYKGIDTVDGIIFIYEENYELEEITLEATKMCVNRNKTKKYKK